MSECVIPEMRVGKIIAVEEPEGLRNKAWVMTLDFGPYGIKKSVGQFKNFSAEEMIGRLVVAVVGLGTKKVGSYSSECLVLGTMVDAADHNLGHYFIEPSPKSKLGDLIG
jgi:tRNA-binding protein